MNGLIWTLDLLPRKSAEPLFSLREKPPREIVI